MKPKALLTVKQRSKPMLAVIVTYSVSTGRAGKVLASEAIPDDFTNADLAAAAKRLVSKAASHKVILPAGIEI
ncbi:hypothetical protein ACQYWY_20450 [Comamonas sediminis]|uniref:hypothetical protein n=1 Tax=Comamonas sediminis TaxID=1783360 RepID=UPI003D2936CC